MRPALWELGGGGGGGGGEEEGGREGLSEGVRERVREGVRERVREGVRERGSRGAREPGSEGRRREKVREGRKEGGREGERGRDGKSVAHKMQSQNSINCCLPSLYYTIKTRSITHTQPYVTVHTKTYRKSAKNIFEIRADFASPIYILDFLQNSCG